MALPKRKKSKRLVRMRRASASWRRKVVVTKPCPECGAPHQSHRVCPSCGYYRGRQVLTVKTE